MIKGKFYSGLTSEMMTRSRTVDRQQTNFFWPDETDAESATPRTHAKRILSTSTTKNNNIANNNNNNLTDTTQSDIRPKELVRKQLSSGIEFYDNVNAKTPESRRRRFKKIDNINLNNINTDTDFQPVKKKLETFSSKIEFYDFDNEDRTTNSGGKRRDEKKDKTEKPVGKAIKMNDDEARRNDDNAKTKMDSPDVGKKRISFQTTEKSAEKTKSILKNSDERPNNDKFIVKPLPKRGLFPKSLSKSVENISKMTKNIENDETGGDIDDSKPVEKLSAIIKEVKNLNLSKDDDRRHNYERDYRDRGVRRNNLDRDYDRGYGGSSYREQYDDYRYEPSYNSRYYDYDERNDRDYMDRRNERFQRNSNSPAPSRDSYEHRDRSIGNYEEGRNRDRRSANHNDYDELKRGPPRTPIREVKPTSPARDVQRKPIERYYDEPSNRSARHEAADDEDEYSACISRKPKHIPQHLRTNILFNGKVRPQAQRPMSVRNSAVTRVGVGLPDIE